MRLMKESIASTVWQFSTTRMLEEYVEQLYVPAAPASATPQLEVVQAG